MPTFTYTGIAYDNSPINGVVEAFDEIEAMEQAREVCRVVQNVKEVRRGSGFLSKDITKPKAKLKNLSIMCSQFATILQSGMSVTRAVGLVANQTNDKYLKRVLTDVASDVSTGHAFAESLESKGSELPRVLIETVRAGEESGHMVESFQRLEKYFTGRARVNAKVASALTYPIFVLVIAVVVVAVMMVMVIPALTEMILSLGSQVPPITQFLINSAAWTSDNILFILLFVALLIVAYQMYKRTEKGKTRVAIMKLKMPVTGIINIDTAASQFASTMSTLIAAGLPVNHAVDITARVINNYVISKETSRMTAWLEEGRTLGECMETCTYFPETLVQMTAVGESTGELEEALATMSEFYDSETQRVTDKALSFLEPALLVLMALFAGFIVIALYLPMFQMYAAM